MFAVRRTRRTTLGFARTYEGLKRSVICEHCWPLLRFARTYEGLKPDLRDHCLARDRRFARTYEGLKHVSADGDTAEILMVLPVPMRD